MTDTRPAVMRLREAAQEQQLVRVHRKSGWQVLDGYVVAMTPDWLLLARLADTIVLDGFAAVRIKDVRKVTLPASGDFIYQALSLRGMWPPRPPASRLVLDSAATIIDSMAANTSAVSLFLERQDPDAVYIGTPLAVGPKSVRLVEVSWTAQWLEPASKYRLNAVTRVDAGGRYESALLEVAGPPPDVPTAS